MGALRRCEKIENVGNTSLRAQAKQSGTQLLTTGLLPGFRRDRSAPRNDRKPIFSHLLRGQIKRYIFTLIFIITVLCISSDIYAGAGDVMWQDDGIPVFFPDNGDMEKKPVAVSDGNNGAIVAWVHEEYGSHSIAIQRLDSAGNKLWWQSGKTLAMEPTWYTGLKIVSDNNGSAIIAWMDDSMLDSKIYTERINSDGESVWDAGYGGIPVCFDSYGTQILTDIVSDGAGGAILVWQDNKDLWTTGKDIYAQRVDSEGNLSWGMDGLAICTAGHNQEEPRLVSDGAGGAIITWHDARAPNYEKDIYAQRVDADGNCLWQENGIAVCSFKGYQENPDIVIDTAGGAIIAWEDNRNTNANVRDIYAQRINALGKTQWEKDGIAVCVKPNDQKFPRLVSDRAFGAFVFWEDLVTGIYVQKVDPNGVLSWDPNGISVGAAGKQFIDDVIEDNFFGAIIVWSGDPEDDCEIHAQDISFTGEKLWTGNGITINGLGSGMGDARIAKGVNSDIVIVWTDNRYDDGDIFAQRVSAGKVPSWQMLVDTLFSSRAESRKADLLMYCIRDRLLDKFPEGRALIYLTYKHASEIGRIISSDSSLKKSVYTALMKVIEICTNYLNNKYVKGYIPLTNDSYKELTYIIEKLSILGSKGLRRDLLYVQYILNKIKGKTISELEKNYL